MISRTIARLLRRAARRLDPEREITIHVEIKPDNVRTAVAEVLAEASADMRRAIKGAA